MAGPLSGIRVIEMGGPVAVAFAGTVLADLGADVLRIDRAAQVSATANPRSSTDPLGRGRRSVALDLKHSDGVTALLDLIAVADVLIEGGRPGVAERLGFGPEQALARNPRLVYGRVTGWGQTGPMASSAGHDITFLSVTGALAPPRTDAAPATAPPYYLSSFAGGALPLVVGVQAALIERANSGLGQVIDAAMTEGTAMLSVLVAQWRNTPGRTTVIDAPFYTTYQCADGRYISVGAVEPRFYAELLNRLGLIGTDLPAQYDQANWPVLATHIAAAFRARDSADWEKVFADSDACVAPVLTPSEVAMHPHLQARESFVSIDGQMQPGPTPRFSRTPPPIPAPAPNPGEQTQSAMADWLPA